MGAAIVFLCVFKELKRLSLIPGGRGCICSLSERQDQIALFHSFLVTTGWMKIAVEVLWFTAVQE